MTCVTAALSTGSQAPGAGVSTCGHTCPLDARICVN